MGDETNDQSDGKDQQAGDRQPQRYSFAELCAQDRYALREVDDICSWKSSNERKIVRRWDHQRRAERTGCAELQPETCKTRIRQEDVGHVT